MEEKHVLTARERKALKTKNKLLEAGKKVLLEQGFQKATVTQIIREAGTGYGTAYVYFKNKDELLIVLMEDVMAKFYDVAGRTFAPKTSKEAYHLIEDQVKSFLSLAVEERDILRVVKEASGVSEAVASYWEDVRSRFIGSIAADIRHVQEKGLAAKHFDPEFTARAWYYANEMFLWDGVRDGDSFPSQKVIQTLTDLYTGGLYKDQEGSSH
jgi:AcrR family transcriptional regulator